MKSVYAPYVDPPRSVNKAFRAGLCIKQPHIPVACAFSQNILHHLRRPRKIRRIRVDPRAIGMHDRPLMDADYADLRGFS